MAKKYIRNKFGNNTPVYECSNCNSFFKKVDKSDCFLAIDEINAVPRECRLCHQSDFVFHGSWKEYCRWCQLRLLSKSGHIKNLKRQVRMPIFINGIKVFTYIADFDYYTDQDKHVIEDAKSGVETDTWKLKRRCIAAYYGVLVKIS